MKYILLFFALYLAFQFIFRLVIPLFMAGRQLRKGFKQMQEQMNEQMRAQGMQDPSQNGPFGNGRPNTSYESRSTTAGKPTPKKEDYIDFEEIKEG